MDITSSQKRSTHSSAKTNETPRPAEPQASLDDESEDHSFDIVERVRKAREASERRMSQFSGNLADYTLVRRIKGRKSEIERERLAAEAALKDGTSAGNKVQLPLDWSEGEGEKKR